MERVNRNVKIKYNKASLQRIFNKANSSKGVNLATLKQAKLLITKLVHDEEYMLRVKAIRKRHSNEPSNHFIINRLAWQSS